MTTIRVGHVWVANAQEVTDNVQDKGKQKGEHGTEIQQRLDPILKNPLFVELDWNQPFSWKADEYASIQLPDEKPEHAGGVFWMNGVDATIWSNTLLNFSVSGESNVRVIAPGPKSIDVNKCEENALALLKSVYPWFFQQGPLPLPRIEEPDRNGIWHFEWQRYRVDGLPNTRVQANVRAIDGKVVSFGSSKLVGVWEHKITPSQAKQKALQIGKSDDLIDIEVVNWSISGGGGTRFYNIRLRASNRKTGQLLYCGMTVDALTGESEAGMHGWQPAENDRQSGFVVNDSLPVWTKQGLVFVSDRKLAGMPDWAIVPSQLFLQNQTGNLFSLTSDLKTSPSFSTVSCVPDSSWIGIEWHGWTYALDLQSGNYRILGHPERRGGLPTINSAGSWAVVTGVGRSGNPDYDLMPDKLERDPLLGLRGRLVMPNSEEFYPIFSPDGQWVYFATSREEKEGQWSHKLQRISAAVALTKEIKRITPDQVQDIAVLSEEVERMSMFPNGIQVLVQNRKGIFAVAIATGTVTRAETQNVQDAELGVPIKEIKDGWAGPTNDRITFSGKTTEKGGKVRWRIYSCRLDGSELKAHTSKDNMPVSLYEFPEGNKTAYDVNKEWALNEIRWEEKNNRSKD